MHQKLNNIGAEPIEFFSTRLTYRTRYWLVVVKTR